MLIRRTLFLFLIALSVNALAEPRNLTAVKKELSQYYDSGKYLSEFSQVIDQATSYLKTRVEQNLQTQNPKQLAIVLDIDETSLSNYSYMVKREFGGTLKQINEEIERGDAPALKPMRRFYDYAKTQNVAIFFVTGRKEPQRLITINNLREAGYSHWNGLYLKPINYKQKSISHFKADTRKKITDMGFDVVESIGDQYSDIEGGYADKGFKLPNPYYYLP